jgi:hypothetical protein
MDHGKIRVRKSSEWANGRMSRGGDVAGSYGIHSCGCGCGCGALNAFSCSGSSVNEMMKLKMEEENSLTRTSLPDHVHLGNRDVTLRAVVSASLAHPSMMIAWR